MVALLLVALVAQEQPPKPANLLAEIKKAYQSVQSAYYEMQVIHPVVQQDQKGVPICVSFKRPGHLRIDLKTPIRQFRAISNGTDLVVMDFKRPNYHAKVKDSNKMGFFPLHMETLALIETDKHLSTAKGARMEKCRLEVKSYSGVHQLIEHRPDGDVIEYQINPTTKLIDRTSVYKGGAKNPTEVYQVDKIELDRKFAADHFVIPKV